MLLTHADERFQEFASRNGSALMYRRLSRVPFPNSVLLIVSLAIIAMPTHGSSGEDTPDRRQEQAVQQALNQLDTMQSQLQDTPGALAQDIAEVLEKTGQLVVDLRAVLDRENATLSAAGWGNILDPERIRADNGFAESEKLLVMAYSSIDRQETLINQFYGKVAEEIQAFAGPQELKASMIEENRRSTARAMALTRERYGVERKIVGQIESILKILVNKQGWSIEDGQLVFFTDSDVERFNVEMARLDELNQDLAKTLAAQAEEAEASAKRLEAIALQLSAP